MTASPVRRPLQPLVCGLLIVSFVVAPWTLAWAQPAARGQGKCNSPLRHQLAEVLAKRIAYNIDPAEYLQQLVEKREELVRRQQMLQSLYERSWWLTGASQKAALWLAMSRNQDKIDDVNATINTQMQHQQLLVQDQYNHGRDLDSLDVREIPQSADLVVIDSVFHESYLGAVGRGGLPVNTQVLLMEDKTTGARYVAFRGTAELVDWLADIGGTHSGVAEVLGGVGQDAFNNPKVYNKLKQWAQLGDLTVVGHSLGGALGQYFIANFPDAVREGVFYNSPGIPANVVEKLTHGPAGGSLPPVTYYLSEVDLVSNGGGEDYVPGEVVMFDYDRTQSGSHTYNSHVEWALTDGATNPCHRLDFDDYKRIRNAARTQHAGAMDVVKEAGGYVIELEGQGAIDWANDRIDTVDKVVDVVESGVNIAVDAGEFVTDVVTDIAAPKWLNDLLEKVPSIPDLDVPAAPRIPKDWDFLPDYEDAYIEEQPIGKPGGTAIPPAGGPADPGDGGVAAPGGDPATGGETPGREGSPSEAPGSSPMPPRPPIHVDHPPGWGVGE